jgi:predicted transcriptional regulator
LAALPELMQAGAVPTRKREIMDYQLEQDSYSKLEVQGLLDRYVQSECDKVRTEYSKKLKTAETERDALKPKDKSETELALDKRAR